MLTHHVWEYKLTLSYHMTYNSTPKDTENMSAQKVVHAWSAQRYSEEPQSGNKPNGTEWPIPGSVTQQ